MSTKATKTRFRRQQETNEWNFTESLSWDLLQHAPHKGMQELVKALNKLYRSEPALYKYNFSYDGFEWINADDADHSVFVYARKSDKPKDMLIVVLNLTPVFRGDFRVAVPKGKWKEIFSTDANEFYGSGKLNPKVITAENVPMLNQQQSIAINLAPLAVSIFKKAF